MYALFIHQCDHFYRETFHYKEITVIYKYIIDHTSKEK